MITTCDKCKWGERQIAPPGDKHEGEVFYYCEATRYLIPERSALELRETCANFLPKGASCDNCDYNGPGRGCPRRATPGLNVCAGWELRA